jgi:hypothetical protein
MPPRRNTRDAIRSGHADANGSAIDVTYTLTALNPNGDALAKVKCAVGPVAKKYGKSSWLVYSCEYGKSILVVSAPTNKAFRSHCTFVADDDGYALRGEGQGDKRVTDAVYKDLTTLTEADIAALISETRKPSSG